MTMLSADARENPSSTDSDDSRDEDVVEGVAGRTSEDSVGVTDGGDEGVTDGAGEGVTGGAGEGVGDDRRFSSLVDCVSDKTLKAIQEMGFTEMMEIQSRSIRPLLEGK